MCKFSKVKNSIRCRMPRGSLFCAVAKSRRQKKNCPECGIYQSIHRMNLRCYFFIPGNYHLMNYDEKTDEVPLALFHVTASENIPFIFREGLRNKKTNIVFLAKAHKYIEYFFSVRKAPVLLRIDTQAMRRDGYRFYRNAQEMWMWIAEEVPPRYINVCDFEENKKDML